MECSTIDQTCRAVRRWSREQSTRPRSCLSVGRAQSSAITVFVWFGNTTIDLRPLLLRSYRSRPSPMSGSAPHSWTIVFGTVSPTASPDVSNRFHSSTIVESYRRANILVILVWPAVSPCQNREWPTTFRSICLVPTFGRKYKRRIRTRDSWWLRQSGLALYLSSMGDKTTISLSARDSEPSSSIVNTSSV